MNNTAVVKYPIGIQTFSEIREEGYIYLDKTPLIYQLVNSGKAYFLSRPRRFGKSLLVSTFESLFSGHKALFEGLAIADTDYDFAEYPVVLLEFSSVDVRQGSDLEQYIINMTNQYASSYGIALEINSYEQRFAELVSKLYAKTGKKVVLLVDEYDKPILDNLFNDQLSAIRGVMNRFYAGVKSLDKHLKFVFITGVSKFAKVSVFSGMNHLKDISLDGRYATLCGITQQELDNNFSQPIEALANLKQLDKPQILAKIKHWYNGYQFHHSAVGVYNPFSLLSLFDTQEFKNYWFTTATPTFLLDLLQKKRYDLKNLTEVKVGEAAFEASDPQEMDIQSLFVQTGYLTIKSYDEPRYQLDFPNYEVKKSFYDSVAARYAQLERGAGQSYTFDLIDALQEGSLETFFKTLKIFFANIPYNITLKHEKYYQSLFYALFKLIGLSIEAEVHTNEGRIDCVVQTDDTIYIIEFKLNGTKEAALQQIHDNNYALKYQGSDKSIVLLGVEFDQKSRNLGDFIQAPG
jgi:hypothetical protein